tara:strand:- start:53867 stop:55345 length:1479 start_codon:yes stop_codon:yes gene_type:complete
MKEPPTMTKFSLLTATAAALIFLPGLAFTDAAEAQSRQERNGSGRSVSSEEQNPRRTRSENRNRGNQQAERRSNASRPSAQPARNRGGQQAAAPSRQDNSRGEARPPASRSDRSSPRGDRVQDRRSDRNAVRSNRGDGAPGRGGPVMDRTDPRIQPAPVRGSSRRDTDTRRSDSHPGSNGSSPRTRSGTNRPGAQAGRDGAYNPRGPRAGSSRPDTRPGRDRVDNPRGPRSGTTRSGSRPSRDGAYNPRSPRAGTSRPAHNPRGPRTGSSRPGSHDYRPGRDRVGYRNDRRRQEYAQRRHSFYRSDHRSDIRWVRHLNVGWNNSRYYGHYGPSTRWRYNSRYYDHGYNTRQFAYYDRACHYQSNGNGTAVGAILGAIIGGAAADGDNVGAGILLGAGFGAVLGSAVSQLDDCDKVQYQYAMNYAFENGQPYYWGNPYSGVRGSIVIRDSYAYGNTECRWGDAEIYMPDGTFSYDQVRMCRDAYGDWEVARQQ